MCSFSQNWSKIDFFHGKRLLCWFHCWRAIARKVKRTNLWLAFLWTFVYSLFGISRDVMRNRARKKIVCLFGWIACRKIGLEILGKIYIVAAWVSQIKLIGNIETSKILNRLEINWNFIACLKDWKLPLTYVNCQAELYSFIHQDDESQWAIKAWDREKQFMICWVSQDALLILINFNFS